MAVLVGYSFSNGNSFQNLFNAKTDLAYGRYENEDYSIIDDGKSTNISGHCIFPGRDYQNLNFQSEQNGPSLSEVVDRYVISTKVIIITIPFLEQSLQDYHGKT